MRRVFLSLSTALSRSGARSLRAVGLALGTGDGDDRGELPAVPGVRHSRAHRRRRDTALPYRPTSAALAAAVAPPPAPPVPPSPPAPPRRRRRCRLSPGAVYAVEVSFFAKVQNVGLQNVSFDAGAYRTGVADALSKPMADVFVTVDADGEALGAAAPADAAGGAQATGAVVGGYGGAAASAGWCSSPRPCVPRPTRRC